MLKSIIGKILSIIGLGLPVVASNSFITLFKQWYNISSAHCYIDAGNIKDKDGLSSYRFPSADVPGPQAYGHPEFKDTINVNKDWVDVWFWLFMGELRSY